MQIKRFEAADMNEALRLVKAEFGENAVILSAKEVRSGGFFGKIKKKIVEITAAIDKETPKPSADSPFSEILSQEMEEEMQTDRVTLSTKQEATRPIEKKIDSRSFPSSTVNPTDFQCEKRQTHLYCKKGKQKRIAMVGSRGAGKSTSLAKLAWQYQVVEKQQVAFCSFDNFSFGANCMLNNIAQMMNLPLVVIHDSKQLQSVLNDMADVDVILIDTPGIGIKEEAIIEKVGRLLRLAKVDEIHLVADATVRAEVFEANAKAFLPLGANRLLFTHVEETVQDQNLFVLRNIVGLPVAFYSDGIDLYNDLKVADNQWLKKVTGSSPLNNLQNRTQEKDSADFESLRHRTKKNTTRIVSSEKSSEVVVNRNSELFHRPDCRSVRSIKKANLMVFSDSEQAVESGFKPCMACCSTSRIEPWDKETNHRQHAKAM